MLTFAPPAVLQRSADKMTDLLVIRSSFSNPSVQEFGAFPPAAPDDDVWRTPPRDKPKLKENQPSDSVSQTMKAVLSCSPGNPRNQRKLKIRALRWGNRVQHALSGEEIVVSKYSSKPRSPVSKQAAGDMAAVSPRMSPRVRMSKRLQQRKYVHRGSNTQEPEEAYREEYSPLLRDKSDKQANRAMVAASPRIRPKLRRSKQLQQRNDVHSGSNTQEATEGYEEEDSSILLGDKRQSTDIDPSCADDDGPDNKTDNCLDVNLVMDQSSPPGDLLEETARWTGEKRAKVPPTSQVAYYKQLVDPRDKEEFWDVYDPEQLNKVHERLALYRIKAHELFWEGKELDIALLKEEYSSDTLRDEGYFEQYEMNREWYFNPEYCERSAFDDYQRLVLRCDVDDTYISWEAYHTACSTLKCDLEFLQFYAELSSELKSIDDDDVEPTKEHFDAQRKRYDIKAHNEAPKIASHFCNISADLVHTGITDCTYISMFDLTYRKDLDCVFFEIWKRIAKDKVDFKDALEDLYKLGLYPLQHRFIKAELEDCPLRSITMKHAYYTHVAHIDEKVPEDEVLVLIKEAVDKIVPKPLIYVDYITKKMEVAKEIGVIS